MNAADVESVASFYTMYNLGKPARHTILVCQNVSCAMAGAESILRAIEEKLRVRVGEVTADGEFLLQEAECLACCGSAPVVQIDGRYYEQATIEEILAAIDQTKNESGKS